jgi:hypothetical protein
LQDLEPERLDVERGRRVGIVDEVADNGDGAILIRGVPSLGCDESSLPG